MRLSEVIGMKTTGDDAKILKTRVKNAQAFKGRGGEGRRGKGEELKGSPKSRTREIMQKLIFSMRATKETLVPNLFMIPV